LHVKHTHEQSGYVFLYSAASFQIPAVLFPGEDGEHDEEPISETLEAPNVRKMSLLHAINVQRSAQAGCKEQKKKEGKKKREMPIL